MAGKAKRTPPRILARDRLVALMAEKGSPSGLRLPSEREMAKEFGVSLGTMTKAVKRLIMEGVINCIPRKGLYAGFVPKTPSIGVLCSDGAQASPVHSPGVVSALLDSLNSRRCMARFLMARSPEHLPELVSHYKLAACVWHLPPASEMERVLSVLKRLEVPYCFTTFGASTGSDGQPLPGNIHVDNYAYGFARLEILAKRGCKSVVYNSDRGTQAFKGALAAAAAFGVKLDDRCVLEDVSEIPDRLTAILDEGLATGLISSGGFNRMALAFEVLKKHPAGRKVQVVMDSFNYQMPAFMEPYQDVNVVAVGLAPEKELGYAAARSIVEALRSGSPAKAVGVVPRLEENWREAFNEIP